jgi:hypothetical protein
MGPPPEVLEQIAAIQSQAHGPGGPDLSMLRTGRGARAGGGGGGRGARARTIDRRVQRKLVSWSYGIAGMRDEIEEAKDKWAVVETLFQSSAGAVGAAVEAEGLLNHPLFGPAIAAMYVKRSPGARDEVIAKLRAILTGEAEAPDRSVPALERQRSAAAALRNLGGADAAQALYDGLVGPEPEPEAAPTAVPGVMRGPGGPRGGPTGPRGGPTGPMGPRGITGPGGPTGPMGGSATRAAVLPAAPYIARALGTMGQTDLLRAALSATGRPFFTRSAVAVQSAALEGLAFLPAQEQPVKILQDLLKLANTEALRQATADAIDAALRRVPA